MREKSSRLLGATLVLTMAVTLMGAALAAPAASRPGAAPQDIPFAEPEIGKTKVGVQVTRQDPEKLTFEVPLYITLAVVNNATSGKTEVISPTTYSIRNGIDPTNGNPASIAVTGLVVQGAVGGKWGLSASAPTETNTLGLSVGGVRLPDVAAGDTAFHSVDIKVGNSAFFQDGKYLALTQAGKQLSLEGVLPEQATIGTTVAPTPQFRLIYTVSLLDGNGTPVGVVYEGPSKGDTGLIP